MAVAATRVLVHFGFGWSVVAQSPLSSTSNRYAPITTALCSSLSITATVVSLAVVYDDPQIFHLYLLSISDRTIFQYYANRNLVGEEEREKRHMSEVSHMRMLQYRAQGMLDSEP